MPRSSERPSGTVNDCIQQLSTFAYWISLDLPDYTHHSGYDVITGRDQRGQGIRGGEVGVTRGRTFAEKLTVLIDDARAGGVAPHSYREMSAAIEHTGGPAMSPAYIQQLATGKRINPKIHYVKALAELFAVPVSYFFDVQEAEAAERPPRDEAKLMAMRAQELSPEGRRQVMDLLELVERYERSERGRSARSNGSGSV
jgi:transcriptional regulator with XRE-family HTH domain